MHRSVMVCLLLNAAVAAQQDSAFDAVSIKRVPSVDRTKPPSRGSPDRFVMSQGTTLELLMSTFHHRRAEVVGAPAWVSSEYYDVVASAGRPVTSGEMDAMLRHMLADRFHLAAHTERRDMQVFALVRVREDGRLGPRIRPWTVDCEALRAGVTSALPTFSSPEAGITVPPCSMVAMSGLFAIVGVPIATFADSLAWDAGRRIVDRTGLRGPFELLLEWSPDAAVDRSLPPLSIALQEQLGLKLEPERAQVDVLVIDRIERPSQN